MLLSVLYTKMLSDNLSIYLLRPSIVQSHLTHCCVGLLVFRLSLSVILMVPLCVCLPCIYLCVCAGVCALVDVLEEGAWENCQHYDLRTSFSFLTTGSFCGVKFPVKLLVTLIICLHLHTPFIKFC